MLRSIVTDDQAHNQPTNEHGCTMSVRVVKLANPRPQANSFNASKLAKQVSRTIREACLGFALWASGVLAGIGFAALRYELGFDLGAMALAASLLVLAASVSH